jgi:hypothetical protein
MNKSEQLTLEIQQQQETLLKIGQEVKSLSRGERSDRGEPSGLPLLFAARLACPKCGDCFDLKEISIHNNQIFSGILSCGCGYRALIEDGVIVTDCEKSFYRSQQFKIEHYHNVPDKDGDFVYFEYMNHISEQTTAMIYKAYTWIHTLMEKLPPPKVVILPDLSCHYLYKYFDMPYFRNALIVVTGFTKDNIHAIKAHFDAMSRHLSILYVANTISEIPIKKGSVDLWIDAIASYNFSFFHYGNTLHEQLNPYFTDDAAVIGLTKYLKPNSKSIKNIRQLYSRAHPGNSLLSMFHEVLGATGWQSETEEVHGFVTSPGEYYEYIDPGEKHWFLGYYGVKHPACAQSLARGVRLDSAPDETRNQRGVDSLKK